MLKIEIIIGAAVVFGHDRLDCDRKRSGCGGFAPGSSLGGRR